MTEAPVLVLVAAGGAPWESAVLRELEDASGLRLARRCMDVAELLAVAATAGAQVAVVDGDLPGLDADVVFRLGSAGVRVLGLGDAPRCVALGVAAVADPRAIAAAAIAGAQGSAQCSAADGATDDDDVGPSSVAGRLVAIWGPTGAPGRSTVALSLAAEAARTGLTTVLVDADVHGGAQAQMVAVLDDVSGLLASCRAVNRGHAEEVAAHLVEVGPGLSLLTGLPRADMWPHVRRAALARLLRHLQEQHDLVVVDCGFGLDEGGAGGGPTRDQVTLHVLEAADMVLAVGRADPVGLARLVRGLHDLSERGVEAPTVVLNQVRRSIGWGERELRSTLRDLAGVEPTALLPADVPTLDLALVRGALPAEVDAGSPFVVAVRRLADALLAVPTTSVRS